MTFVLRTQRHRAATAPRAPSDLQAKGYERHVQLTWKPVADEHIAEYVIYRSLNGGPFLPVGVQRPSLHRAMDFIGDAHAKAVYKMSARTSAMRESAMSNEASAATHPMSDDELLTMVQEASFQYYWDGAEPTSGMARESIPGDPDLIAVGGSGFGIMALIVGADRGFAPRDEIVDRMLRITAYLARADRFHGAWPHFLSGSTGHIRTILRPLRRWRRPGRDVVPDGRPALRARLLHARYAEGASTARRDYNPLARRRVGLVQRNAETRRRSTGTGRRTLDFTPPTASAAGTKP